MPIYEMEPPPGTTRFVIPYPDEPSPKPRGFRVWLKRVPTPEEEVRIARRTDTVMCWLIIIFFVWLGQTFWDDMARIFTTKTVATIVLFALAALL